MIKVAVAGYAGRMGSAVVDAVTAADNMNVVCGIDPHAKEAPFPVFDTLAEALDATDVDVLVDFTQPNVVAGNLSVALPRGVDCVVGTTGLSNETLEGLAASAAPGTCLFYAPNFTTGAVLMMEFAKAAAPYFPEAEVIEYHHCNKKDAPSGTAVRTAEIIAKARAPRVSEATPCAPWALWPARRSSSARWAKPSPSVTTRGIALPTCPASCWASAAWGSATASSSALRTL